MICRDELKGIRKNVAVGRFLWRQAIALEDRERARDSYLLFGV